MNFQNCFETELCSSLQKLQTCQLPINHETLLICNLQIGTPQNFDCICDELMRMSSKIAEFRFADFSTSFLAYIQKFHVSNYKKQVWQCTVKTVLAELSFSQYHSGLYSLSLLQYLGQLVLYRTQSTDIDISHVHALLILFLIKHP